jgi:ABC-2 type transport system permease protein
MLKLFWAELKRDLTLQRRYMTEVIAAIAGIVIAFYGIFLTTRYVAGPGLEFGDRLDTLVVGYVLWSLATFIISDIAGGLQQEALTGTLEQLFLSPFRASTVFLVRALARLTIHLSENLIILLIIATLTRARLSFPPLLILPLISVLLGAYGLALAVGATALLLKRVQQLLGFLPFGLFFLLLVPTESWSGLFRPLGWLLPMAPGAGLLRDLIARGQALDGALLAIALLNGLGYFGLGVLLFRQAERVAKRRGKLAGY